MKKHILPLVLIPFSASLAFAQSGTYNGNANANWTVTDNWLNSIVADGAGSTATIDRSAFSSTRTITVDTGTLTIGSINFVGVPSAQRNAAINGGTIVFDNNGSVSQITNSGWGAGTINSDIQLANDLELRNSPYNNLGEAADRFLTLDGNVTSSDGTLRTITTLPSTLEPTTGDNQFRIVFSGSVSGNVAIRHDSGNALNFQGTAAKTFSGGLNIRSGIVRSSAGLGSSALGTGTITFEAGGAKAAELEFSGAVENADNRRISQSIVLEGDGLIRVNDGSLEIAVDSLISGGGDLIKEGVGTLLLNTQNAYTGDTVISEGSIALGVDNAINVASALVLNGGSLLANGHSQSFAELLLTGVALIDLGIGGTNVVTFADSSAVDWGTYSLVIGGDFIAGQSIRFGTNANGLTASQLAAISIAGWDTLLLDSNGYLIPEPGTWAMILGGIALAGTCVVRRRHR